MQPGSAGGIPSGPASSMHNLRRQHTQPNHKTRTLMDTWARPLGILLSLVMVIAAISLVKSARYPDLGARQARADVLAGPLDSDHDLLQTFTSSKAGLSRLAISFRSLRQGGQEQPARLQLELRNASGLLVGTSTFSVPVGPHDFNLNFDFAPQAESLGQKYELRIKTDAAPDTVAAWSSGYDLYQQGNLQVDGIRVDRDLTFSASCGVQSLWWSHEELQRLASRAGALLTISIAFAAVGFMLSLLLGATPQSFPIASLAYALPAGISLPPILLWLLGLLGMKIEQGMLAALAAALVLGSVLRVATLRRSFREIRIPWAEVAALGLLFILAILTRLIQIEDLVVPNWVDGVMHAGVVRDIKRMGALPPGNLYHVGFHAGVLVTQILTRRSVVESMLVYGQWLGVVSGICFYLLARTLFRNRYTALLVTCLYWFVAPFPSYLFTWGRYPLLQGLVLLPAGAALTLRGLRPHSSPLLLAFILIGLFLSHYGVALLALFLLVAVLISRISLRRRLPAWRPLLAAAVVMLPLSAAAGTKILGLLGSSGWLAVLSRLNHSVSTEEFRHLLSIVLGKGGAVVLLIGLAGATGALLGDSGLLRLMTLWALGMFAIYVAQDRLIGISAFGAQNAAIFISLPLCILAGVVFNGLFRVGGRVLPGLMCAAAGLWIIAGAYSTSAALNPDTVMFLPGDRGPLNWIRKNTSPKSLILIDSFVWERHYVASDSGAWITQLTGRRTVFLKHAEEFAQLDAVLSNSRIDYVYLGSGSGDLALYAINSPLLELAYQENGARIYRVRADAASSATAPANLTTPASYPCTPPLMGVACRPLALGHQNLERYHA